jgi:hypothetical protein
MNDPMIKTTPITDACHMVEAYSRAKIAAQKAQEQMDSAQTQLNQRKAEYEAAEKKRADMEKDILAKLRAL